MNVLGDTHESRVHVEIGAFCLVESFCVDLR